MNDPIQSLTAAEFSILMLILALMATVVFGVMM